jgi:hypothetical protein
MRYKDFYVRITPDKYIPRVDKKGRDILCEGFLIQVFADETERIEIDNFSAAVLRYWRTVWLRRSSWRKIILTVRGSLLT